MTDLDQCISERSPKLLGAFAVVLKKIESMALRRARPDPRQTLECRRQPVKRSQPLHYVPGDALALKTAS